MNIEDLSKTQMLFLTILVSFITSIATGVLTVSLLDVAPPTVTQTVNQIVDHTIETVTAPVQPSPKPTTTPSTEDLITAAIAEDASRTVSIHKSDPKEPSLGVGTYLPDARAVATLSSPTLPKEAVIVFPDGSMAAASESHIGATITIYGFSDSATLPKAAAPKLLSQDALKQGMTVIALTDTGAAVTGIVSKVDENGVMTTLPWIPAGSAAVNVNGDVVGISSGAAGLYAPADKITTLLAATSTSAAQ